MPSLDAEGDVARILITGCSTGFGRAAAVELTGRGHEVVATARRAESIADLPVARRLGLDVLCADSVTNAVAAAGPIDALVNNAGVGLVGPFERVDLEDARRVFETNFFGAVRMMQAVLPAMRERGAGTIVNVTSIAGRVAPPLEGFYSASKFALEGLSEALHHEVGHFGVRVRIVEPGLFDTGFSGRALRCGVDAAPYDELDRQWAAARVRLVGAPVPTGPGAVAVAIADAVESTAPRLRWPVGADAEMVLTARASMDDETFEAAMRSTLEIDW
jgi:NAD(P)-dependent dehydrogenase (short-subunit alcohol dehydrogenase family)